MPELIGLVGVIGSGKTYQRDKLIKEGFTPIDFKDELIAITEDLLGFEIRSQYDLFKETVAGVTKPAPKMLESAQRIVSRRFLEQFPQAPTGRTILQRMGTEVMRKRDPDFWVNCWAKKAEKIFREQENGKVVVADVRFDNEVSKILSYNFWSVRPVTSKLMFCDFHSDRYCPDSKHESEALAQSLIAMGVKDGQGLDMGLDGKLRIL